MKLILISSLLAVMSFSVSANQKKKGPMFDKMKAHMIENVDKRIAILTSLKSCTSAAQDKDAVKACRKANKDSMKALKESNKSFRKQIKADRKKK